MTTFYAFSPSSPFFPFPFPLATATSLVGSTSAY